MEQPRHLVLTPAGSLANWAIILDLGSWSLLNSYNHLFWHWYVRSLSVLQQDVRTSRGYQQLQMQCLDLSVSHALLILHLQVTVKVYAKIISFSSPKSKKKISFLKFVWQTLEYLCHKIPTQMVIVNRISGTKNQQYARSSMQCI